MFEPVDATLFSHNDDTMVVFDFPVTPRRTREEDVYEDLCYVTLRVNEVVPCLSQSGCAPKEQIPPHIEKGPAFFS